jgi:hypothetical protein
LNNPLLNGARPGIENREAFLASPVLSFYGRLIEGLALTCRNTLTLWPDFVSHHQSDLFMKKAFVFPGQGAQFVGMGKDLYEYSVEAKPCSKRPMRSLDFVLLT